MTQKKSSARLNSSSDKRFNKDTKGQIYICPFFMFIFLLKGQKKNEPKRKNLFNVSLTLHWASLRGSLINISRYNGSKHLEFGSCLPFSAETKI